MTRLPPNSSRKPIPPPLAMSTAPPDPRASPAPSPLRDRSLVSGNNSATSSSSKAPIPKPSFSHPKLRLEIRDLSHPGVLIFFSAIPNPTALLSDAVVTVLQTIYTPFEGDLNTPGVRSVTLVLRSMEGVAYTTGTELDDEHKEIHFSLDYIAGVKEKPAGRRRQEILGVMLHEMVHVWQWNGEGTAPSGLIEGIADLVRLRAGLSPPHWKREPGGNWDAGYQHTAYFLDWLEAQYDPEKVLQMNETLRVGKYEETKFWKGLFGKEVKWLWERYNEDLKNTDQD